MPTAIPSFEEYVASLGALTSHVDPTLENEEGRLIKAAAEGLAALESITRESLAAWVAEQPRGTGVGVLGLVVGLSQEALRNSLRHGLGSPAFPKAARENPVGLVDYMEAEYSLLSLLESQRGRQYDFGDVLVARAGTRALATRAGQAGRQLEDEIEEIAKSLGLPYQTRCRFEGRTASAPCDLALPAGDSAAQIVVAAKSFGSTGSKLTDAVREIEEMALVRKPTQFVFAVIDGIGWKGRINDLRRIYNLWSSGQINGMYTLASLGQFQDDLAEAAAILRMTKD
ncbi:hypothetical protein [Arthrobacter sp. U41]|uniref:hypothetical protein n=1 Tax=Arthrobacter sp. U41 TaxID=1849032 RepID=UPI000A79CC26|nr:hypothetical protein [Arthrobacter sp. U41]